MEEENAVEVESASFVEDTSGMGDIAVGSDLLSKPFSFVSGNVSKKGFFGRKKERQKKFSGLLSVISKQSTRSRIVLKNGNLNTTTLSSGGKSHRFVKDFFISILDLDWSWIFFMFATAFFASWLLFAVVWYLIAYGHGDFDPENLTSNDHVVCMDNVEDFATAFLFSVETQHTIGYGGRATTSQCALAIIVMCIQSILGVVIQACMAGIIFAKFTVPRTRGKTIIFSKNAIITSRNGSLYLLCRISDLRRYSLLEAHVRMILIHKVETSEGETIPYHESEMECGSELDGSNDRVLIMWPTTIAHKIDESSPLYNLAPHDLPHAHFEVVVTLEGVTEETGNTVQARTSYVPNEVLWGYRFNHETIDYDKKAGVYMIKHSALNNATFDNATPRLSAKALDEKRNP